MTNKFTHNLVWDYGEAWALTQIAQKKLEQSVQIMRQQAGDNYNQQIVDLLNEAGQELIQAASMIDVNRSQSINTCNDQER